MPSTRSNQPFFESLETALRFIESRLDEGNAVELFAACIEDRVSEYLRPIVFERLQAIHAEKNLCSLYLNCSPPLAFPIAEEKFKLGGHGKELGHIHIDFLKRDHRWQLASIWMCR